MAGTIYAILILILFFIPKTVQLDYLCRPNGSFVINNPDNTKYKMVHVKDDQNKCSTQTFSDDFTTLQIDGCLMDHYVTLVFIKGPKLPLILTRNNFIAFRIMCRGLPPGGIEILVSTSLGVRNHVEELGQARNTEITRVFSNVEDSDPIPPVTVSVTDKFEWHIRVKDTQHALPIRCIAYAGKTVSEGAESLGLMENGCSTHGEVKSKFARVPNTEGTNTNLFVVQFYAFRFKDNPFITVACSIRVCDETTKRDCMSNCNNRRRRRRALRRISRESNQVTDMSLVLEVVDKKPARREARDHGSDVMERMIYNLNSGTEGSFPRCSPVLLMVTIVTRLSYRQTGTIY